MYSPERTRSTATGLRCAFSRKWSVGHALAQIREHARPPAGENRLGDAEHEPAAAGGALARDGEPELGEERPRALEQSLRGGRETHAPARALAQPHAELSLERVQPLGHRGLRDAQPQRGAVHGAVLGERGERLDLVDHD